MTDDAHEWTEFYLNWMIATLADDLTANVLEAANVDDCPENETEKIAIANVLQAFLKPFWRVAFSQGQIKALDSQDRREHIKRLEKELVDKAAK